MKQLTKILINYATLFGHYIFDKSFPRATNLRQRALLLIIVTMVIFAGILKGTVVLSQERLLSRSSYRDIKKGHAVFRVSKPDFKLSPYTGMSRTHWEQAARYLLEGAFAYIHDLEDPMTFPKQPGKSYPRNAGQVRTEKLEGLCRTLFIAAPLLRENPALQINGIKVAEYYRHQIVKLINPESDTYIKAQKAGGGPDQILVEFGALSLSLFVIPDILFDPLEQRQRDSLASAMLSYGDGKTVPSNWKFFNIFILSFFKSKGYHVNEPLLVEYLNKCLEHYRGDGWYNDAPAYDYYSMWAFQMYGPLWSALFGKEYYPDIAEKFMENFEPISKNYPYVFGRSGKMVMWGRSISYRIGSVIPLALTGLKKDFSVNYGWMRRIASGVLLQFLTNPGFIRDGIPTLGFYGAFEPAVQPYSCRGSVFWMGKAFFALLLPPDNPFWTATENEGAWEGEMDTHRVYNQFHKGSNILVTDYPGIGASEIRAWCHVKAIGAREPFRASENYNKLAYNSAFPWAADSVDGVISMNYIFKNKQGDWEPLRLYDFRSFDGHIYSRGAELETNPNIRLNLAEIPLANGILRVDRISSDTATEMRLGHYALPFVSRKLTLSERMVNGYRATIIDNGQYQLAMVPLAGWQQTKVFEAAHIHPEAALCSIIDVLANIEAGQQRVYATLMLWKKSGEEWSDVDLLPVRDLQIDDQTNRVKIELGNSAGIEPHFIELDW